jgi:RNA polymerase sigma-70 factor (ECF subfamily)
MEPADPEEPARQSNAARESGAAAPLDEDLIARLFRHEEPALSGLYDRYSRLIYSVALRITGDRAAAAEALEVVFETIWQFPGSFQAGDSVAGWLIRMTRSRAIDANRSHLRAYEEAVDDEHAARATLAQLPPAPRRVLDLAYYGGLTYAEIAARLGEPVGTVKSLLRLGLMELYEQLGVVEEGQQEDTEKR